MIREQDRDRILAEHYGAHVGPMLLDEPPDLQAEVEDLLPPRVRGVGMVGEKPSFGATCERAEFCAYRFSDMDRYRAEAEWERRHLRLVYGLCVVVMYVVGVATGARLSEWGWL